MNATDLKAWRERLGMSQSQAASALGVPTRTLQGLEGGRSPSSPLWGPMAVIARYVERFGALTPDHPPDTQ